MTIDSKNFSEKRQRVSYLKEKKCTHVKFLIRYKLTTFQKFYNKVLKWPLFEWGTQRISRILRIYANYDSKVKFASLNNREMKNNCKRLSKSFKEYPRRTQIRLRLLNKPRNGKIVAV